MAVKMCICSMTTGQLINFSITFPLSVFLLFASKLYNKDFPFIPPTSANVLTV